MQPEMQAPVTVGVENFARKDDLWLHAQLVTASTFELRARLGFSKEVLFGARDLLCSNLSRSSFPKTDRRGSLAERSSEFVTCIETLAVIRNCSLCEARVPNCRSNILLQFGVGIVCNRS